MEKGHERLRIRALTFDVFGTVVDWRGSIIREMSEFGEHQGIDADWAAFADAWRAQYQPAMEKIRTGKRPWKRLDVLHRKNLEKLRERFGLSDLPAAKLDHINRVWHRLAPWPDTVEGLQRLRQRYILATLSNGNISLLVNLSKFGNLPWDVILGAEFARQYKPTSETYLMTAEALDLHATECLMVAAHNEDLQAAARCGFRTAFVARPLEHGIGQERDLEPEGCYDYVAKDFCDLATQLGCP